MHPIIEWYSKVNHFGAENGFELRILRPGKIEYTFTPGKNHEALPAFVHGGALAGFMDAVLSVAGLSAVAPDNMLVSTIEFKINYLSSVKSGEQLTGTGTVVRKGNRILVTEGAIRSSKTNDLKAVGTGSLSAIQFDTSKIEN